MANYATADADFESAIKLVPNGKLPVDLEKQLREAKADGNYPSQCVGILRRRLV